VFSGYYKDLGTTPATATNDLVRQWTNQVGSNPLYSPGISNTYPLLKLNQLNGFAGLQFNGLAQFLTVASGCNEDPCTLVIVGNWNGSQTDPNPRIAGYNIERSFYRNGSAHWGYYYNQADVIHDLTQSADTVSVAVLRVDNSALRTFRFNGANTGSIQGHTLAGSTRLAIGCHGSDGLECGSCIVYEVLHYPYLPTGLTLLIGQSPNGLATFQTSLAHSV